MYILCVFFFKEKHLHNYQLKYYKKSNKTSKIKRIYIGKKKYILNIYTKFLFYSKNCIGHIQHRIIIS